MSMGSCIHGVEFWRTCSACQRMFDPTKKSHDFDPWSMKCRGCGWTKSQIENWAKTTPMWDTCRGEQGPVPGPVYAGAFGVPLSEAAKLPRVAVEPEPTRRTRVYVSGPLTTGMLTANVRRAADAANELLEAGFAVYLPHTNVLWEMMSPPIDDYEKGYEKWLGHDFEWVAACDLTLRLAGESHGADREGELALKLGQKIYATTFEIIRDVPPTRPR